ncbi:MAG: sensor histidine kinase, partial [Sphingobacteriia bacterium]
TATWIQLRQGVVPQKINLPPAPSGVFLYKANGRDWQMVYWNSNTLTVQPQWLTEAPKHFFYANANGQYLVKQKTTYWNNEAFRLVVVLPVYVNYFLQNRYFQSDFVQDPGLAEQYNITNNESDPEVHGLDGKALFSIRLQEGKAFLRYDNTTIFLRTLGTLFVLLFVRALSLFWSQQRGFRWGFGSFLLSLVLLRAVTYYLPVPFVFSKLPLFDPAIYASSTLHPSLGDLIINTLLVFWVIYFYRKHCPFVKQPASFVAGKAALFLGAFMGMAYLVTTLVRDAQISFDVNQFFSLNQYSLWGMFLLSLFSLILYHLAFLCFPFRKDSIMGQTMLGSKYFVLWTLVMAAAMAVLVSFQGSLKEEVERKRLAEQLAAQTDPSGENLLNIAATNLQEGLLYRQFDRFQTSEFTNKFLKDSLINQNFSGYLNKFDTRIYVFDSLYHPLYNDDSLNYASLRTLVLNQASPTDVPGLYRYESSVKGLSYLLQKSIALNDRVLGYLFVVLQDKRYKSEALYPELFNQSRDLTTDLNQHYAYAVYASGKLINHFNQYDFPAALDTIALQKGEFQLRKANGHTELWYQAANGRTVVVVKASTWLTDSLTLFAYLFCGFLVLFLLAKALYFLWQSRRQGLAWKQVFQFSLRTQIQASIVFLSVFSFLVIGAATISFFIFRYNSSNEERLTKSIQVMANEVNTRLQNLVALDDMTDHPGIRYELERVVAEISDLHNVDINFFNETGDLLVSTQPYIYNKHLLSEKMEPKAFAALRYEKKIRFLQSESIGKFNFLSVYVPLPNSESSMGGFLNIPYLNSQNELNQEISGFLATLIDLNAFIILLAGVLAFFLTNRITASLQLIGQTMQQLRLDGKNQKIELEEREDEIGLLVREYNGMVKKLEASAAQLARNEREGAWREMARQVAHEIKNPLTPMKLSLQYLQQSIRNNAPNVQALTTQMTETLIEQIDQLTKIAGDFSQFANIGHLQPETFDLRDLITAQTRLFQANPLLELVWELPENPLLVNADKVQINRLFTNLLQNALEAGLEKNGHAWIQVQAGAAQEGLWVRISDKSGGMPEKMKAHVFQPNFTTKSSGTGLGLAICKGIMEKAGGHISYKSTDGEGTTFRLTFPLAP